LALRLLSILKETVVSFMVVKHITS
jgi:hypothetical protein